MGRVSLVQSHTYDFVQVTHDPYIFLVQGIRIQVIRMGRVSLVPVIYMSRTSDMQLTYMTGMARDPIHMTGTRDTRRTYMTGITCDPYI